MFWATASDVSPKEQQNLMARAWFSLAKKNRTTPIEHSFGDNWVHISASENYPIATIWDNDILLFLISQLMFAVNNGHPTSRRIRFTGWDFFRFIGAQSVGGSDYEALWKRLERLHRTFIQTNLHMGSITRDHSFTWLSEIERVRDGNTGLGFECVLPDWLYQSVVKEKSVLTLDEDYFRIRGGLERWLYLWARKSAGNQRAGWSETPESLYSKSGSLGTFSAFTRSFKKITAKGSILDYSVESVKVRRSHQLLFTPTSNTRRR